MSFAAVGSAWGANASTVTGTTQGIGNLIIIEVQNWAVAGTSYAKVISSSRVTWITAGVQFLGSTNPATAQVFLGVVNSTGSDTVSVTTWSGATPATGKVFWAAQEFTSTTGSWAFDKQANLDNAGTATWPSITPAVTGEIYWGHSGNLAAQTAGSTSGYVFNGNVDAVGDSMAYNPACSTGSTHPVWGSAQSALGIMIMVQELSPSTPGAVNDPQRMSWPTRFRWQATPVAPPAPVITNVSVVLPVAQLTVAGPAPVVTETGALAVGATTVSAPLPFVQIVNPASQIGRQKKQWSTRRRRQTAPQPVPILSLPLPTAQVTLTAPAPTAASISSLAVGLVALLAPSPATLITNPASLTRLQRQQWRNRRRSQPWPVPGPQPSQTVGLNAGAVNVTALAPSISAGCVVALPVAQATVAAPLPAATVSPALAAGALVIGGLGPVVNTVHPLLVAQVNVLAAMPTLAISHQPGPPYRRQRPASRRGQHRVTPWPQTPAPNTVGIPRGVITVAAPAPTVHVDVLLTVGLWLPLPPQHPVLRLAARYF
jgi:hypothetical protein